jgi:trk system potassium uptake protein TrkH
MKLGWSPQQNLLYGFLTYVVLGTLLLSLPISQKYDVSILDNLFTATSAVSTTGLVTVSIFDTYNFWGQLIVMCLFQIGGIGYLTFTTFMLLSTTRKLTHWHERILTSEFTLPTTIKIRHFLKSVILFTVIMESLGAVLFFFAFKADGMPMLQSIWNAIFHSISAFCTAGFSLFANGFVDYANDGFINFIISMLAISGSLGFIVVTDFYLFLKKKAHKLSFTTKIILYGFAVLLIIGTGFLYFLEPSITALSGYERFLVAFFQAMSSMTTVGFNTIDFGGFVLPMLLVVTFLMYVGASPSGTAGGIKITTLSAVYAIMKSRLRASNRITFLGRTIPYERLYIATSAFIFYSSLILVGVWLLSFTETGSFEQLLFETASALGTVGLSTGITSELTSFGKLCIIVLMFIGRLGVLTFGLAIWSKKITNSEEKILEEDIAV